MKKRLEILITIALVLCALFCLLTFFNVSWFVVLFASHCLETIIGLILGFAVAMMRRDDKRSSRTENQSSGDEGFPKSKSAPNFSFQ